MKIPILVASLCLVSFAPLVAAEPPPCLGAESDPGDGSYHCTGMYVPADCFGSYSVHPGYEPHCTGICSGQATQAEQRGVLMLCYDEPPNARLLA
jgi:hypothetical protein